MREILFRGKRKLDGVWIYGDLLYNSNCVKIRENETGIDHIAKSFEVDPDTIGQYTGLTDKNGMKIFEGDIVAVDYCKDLQGVCAYNTSPTPRRYIGFYINWGHYADIKRADIGYWYNKVLVIGNIHDNPELLGGGGDEQ